MPTTQYSRDEIIRRGQAIYDEQIRPKVEAANRGKFLVIDVETGEYEIDADEVKALHRAKAKNADAVLYLLRIGFPTAYRLGNAAVAGQS
jgi:hypothetical protein